MSRSRRPGGTLGCSRRQAAICGPPRCRSATPNRTQRGSVPEQLVEHGQVALDQRPLVPAERGQHLGHHLGPVQYDGLDVGGAAHAVAGRVVSTGAAATGAATVRSAVDGSAGPLAGSVSAVATARLSRVLNANSSSTIPDSA